MLRTCYTLLAFALSFTAFAQKDLRPGYILQQKDTIRGFVKYREGHSGLQKCSFSRDRSGELTTYSPSEIEGFGFETRHYISVKIDSVLKFSELIIEGRASLIRTGEVYFVMKGDETVSLANVEKEIYRDGLRYHVNDIKYIGKLKILFSDCPSSEAII